MTPRLIALLAACLLAATSHAEVPAQLRFQGRLQDGAGAPMTGAVTLTARLYVTEAGGGTLWTETDVVALSSHGTFVTTLGDTTALDPGDFDRPLWVGLTVDEAGGGTELSPRTPLRAAPYALSTRRLSRTFLHLPADLSRVVTSEDVVLVAPPTAPGVTITLPDAAAAPSRAIWLKRTGPGGEDITSQAAGGLIDGAGSGALTSTTPARLLASDGTDWWVLEGGN